MGKYDPDNFIDTPAAGAPAAADKYAPDNFVAPPPAAPPGASRTWGDTLRSAGQTAIDFGTAAGSSATFGLDVRRDALAGWLAGDYPSYSAGVEAERAKLAKQRERSPIASVAGDVAGAVALPGMGGARLAANLGGRALARGIGYGAEGAAVGALQGAGNTFTGKPIDYLTNATTGGVMGGVLGGLGGAAFGPRGGMQSTARVPTLPEQRAATDMAYSALRTNPAAYDAATFRGAGGQLRQRMLDEGYVPDYARAAFRAPERMEATAGIPNAVVTPANIESIRQGLNRIPRTPEAAVDRGAARIARNALDDFMVNPPPGAVLPGSQAAAADAARIADIARQSHAGASRSQKMANMREAAENQAASSYSGLNVENNIRNQVKNFVNPNTGGRERLAGYSPEEQAALHRIIRGGAVANVGRWAGNVVGGGGGIAVPIAAVAGNEFIRDNPALSAAVPAAGLGLRMLSNRAARGNIRAAEDLIARRNPLYQQRAANAPMAPPPGGAGVANARDALTTELVKQGYFQTDDGKLIPRITVNADYGQ